MSRIKFNQRLSAIIILLAVGMVLFIAGFIHRSAAQSEPDGYIKTLTQKWLAQCYTQDCVNSGLKSITSQVDTQTALASLGYYQNHVANYLYGDNHLRAHYIGEQTYKVYGFSSQTLLSCGTNFNYGCMHGYIEQAQSDKKGLSTIDLAKQLCGPIEDSARYNVNQKHMCYHGVGHAVAEDENYDLTVALKDCDELAGELAQNACWQGVFMENEYGNRSRATNNGTFSKTDPLAPCDVVEAKYRSQCYVNQEGYLFQYFNYDISKASKACLGAGDQTSDCILGIGLAASSEVWQPLLLHKEYSPQDMEANSWQLCRQFPKDYISSCVNGAIFQILEVDSLNFSRANKLCQIVGANIKKECYLTIGRYAGVQASKNPASYCSQLPTQWQKTCQDGAGERSQS